ncbi:hypothetical protein [Marinobacter sp.]|uniref:hypothetical protein n=1 Tax=Marinobacter sp. TaxID=50741 RepID=UPI003B52B3B6
MKKVIIAAAISALFSTMATANSGLADRINEARTYPNKTVSTERTKMNFLKDRKTHKDMNQSGMEHKGVSPENHDLDHAHS